MISAQSSFGRYISLLIAFNAYLKERKHSNKSLAPNRFVSMQVKEKRIRDFLYINFDLVKDEWKVI